MTTTVTIALLAYTLLLTAQSVALWRLEVRVHKLEVELRHLAGRPTLPEWESVAGTGNVHRRKLGWRVRVALWWIGVREKLAKWIGGK